MVSKYPYGCAINYICDKFGDFQRPFKSTSKCFCYKFFRIELRCELLHSSVAMETCFGQLGLPLENCISYTFTWNYI